MAIGFGGNSAQGLKRDNGEKLHGCHVWQRRHRHLHHNVFRLGPSSQAKRRFALGIGPRRHGSGRAGLCHDEFSGPLNNRGGEGLASDRRAKLILQPHHQGLGQHFARGRHLPIARYLDQADPGGPWHGGSGEHHCLPDSTCLHGVLPRPGAA